jgi:hypothetical protein
VPIPAAHCCPGGLRAANPIPVPSLRSTRGAGPSAPVGERSVPGGIIAGGRAQLSLVRNHVAHGADPVLERLQLLARKLALALRKVQQRPVAGDRLRLQAQRQPVAFAAQQWVAQLAALLAPSRRPVPDHVLRAQQLAALAHAAAAPVVVVVCLGVAVDQVFISMATLVARDALLPQLAVPHALGRRQQIVLFDHDGTRTRQLVGAHQLRARLDVAREGSVALDAVVGHAVARLTAHEVRPLRVRAEHLLEGKCAEAGRLPHRDRELLRRRGLLRNRTERHPHQLSLVLVLASRQVATARALLRVGIVTAFALDAHTWAVFLTTRPIPSCLTRLAFDTRSVIHVVARVAVAV